MICMDLKTFLAGRDRSEREQFAAQCGAAVGHLMNVGYGYKPCAPLLAAEIERASAGAVTRRELRPHDWHRIWPELVTADHPAPAEAA